jgi:hypothetical protein
MMTKVHPLIATVPIETQERKRRRNSEEKWWQKCLPKKSTSYEEKREPLLLSLYQASPASVDEALAIFEKSKGFDGKNYFAIYNFGLSHDFYLKMLNPAESQEPILQLLESDNEYITKKHVIRAMINAFWNSALRTYLF